MSRRCREFANPLAPRLGRCCSSLFSGTVTGIAALVEHDAPAAILASPPDRIERCDTLALRVVNRAAALWARAPESSTSTDSGAHENGAVGPSKNAFHRSTTSDLPRIAPFPPKNTASSSRKVAKAFKSRFAIVSAKAPSASRTCRARSSIVSDATGRTEQSSMTNG